MIILVYDLSEIYCFDLVVICEACQQDLIGYFHSFPQITFQGLL